jgi:uncharacterized protein with gpF-like domain
MSKRLINGSPQTEQRRQERLLILMERRFGRLLAAEVARASRVMLQQYEATGAAPSLPDNHARNVADIYRQMTLMAVEVFGERIVSQGVEKAHPYTFDGGKSFAFAIGTGLRVDTKSFAEFFARLASEYVNGEAIRQRITNVAETTRSSILGQIRRGQDEGLGTRAIAKLINSNVGGISRMRGALIARTETHGAANYGADGAARATGLKLRKEWVAAEDERTRESHRLADGKTVDMDQAFNVDGEQLMYPGDPSASAGNVINCRCAVSHIVDD